MDYHKILILISLGLSSISCSHFSFHEYFYISSPKTWKDAQLYCREKHADLATFASIEEVNQLNRPATISGEAWIGLHDDPTSWRGPLGNDTNSFKWSTTGQRIRSEYTNWYGDEPSYWLAKDLCVAMRGDASWDDAACSSWYPSICYTDMGQNQKTYTFYSTASSWNDAQAYCRQHHTDLAVITSAEENAMAKSVNPTTSWIGLYRIPWAWSDMTPISFTKWGSGSPDNFNVEEHCVVEDDFHNWNDAVCATEKPFICYEVRETKSTMTLKMKTTADLTDPVVQEQILQKLRGVFVDHGWTKFNLQWTTRPQKHQSQLP